MPNFSSANKTKANTNSDSVSLSGTDEVLSIMEKH